LWVVQLSAVELFFKEELKRQFLLVVGIIMPVETMEVGSAYLMI